MYKVFMTINNDFDYEISRSDFIHYDNLEESASKFRRK